MARELLPNSTQIPDVILDFWLSELSGAELKVVLYIARRTFGFGKQRDNISLNQMAEGIRKRDGTPLDRGTGLSRSTVKTACAQLVDRGIILKTTNVRDRTGEFEESTYQLNLDWTHSDGDDGPKRPVGRDSAQVGQMPGGGVGRKAAQGRQQIASDVGRLSAPQETDQETGSQETAADRSPDAAALLKRLVDQELNRADAVRLAREKPEECLRQLNYLVFLVRTRFKFRTGKGAYLRRAIEDGYAPPPGFVDVLKAKAHQAEHRERQKAQEARSATKERWLRETLARLQIERPEAFTDFIAYLETKKQAALDNPILQAAPGLRQKLLRSFDSEETRLDLFEEYMAGYTHGVQESRYRVN